MDKMIDLNCNSWDEYFYKMCIMTSLNSKCLSRKIGAILVQDNSIISTGYNGPPRGIPHCNSAKWFVMNPKIKYEIMRNNIDPNSEICPRYMLGFKSGEGLHICIAGHAERNALINAARNGICTKGTTMYMSCGIPCKDCFIEIINAGVSELVVTSMNYYDEMTPYLTKTSNIRIREFEGLENYKV